MALIVVVLDTYMYRISNEESKKRRQKWAKSRRPKWPTVVEQ